MPLKIPDTELQDITQAISRFSNGASVSELMNVPELVSFAKRTLQRRLEHLITQGKITPKGEGRGRRYLRKNSISYPSIEKPSLIVAEPSDKEWVSPEGVEIEFLISRPTSSRTPVGYKDAFLESYEPNVSTYLTPQIRAELATIGKVGMTELPAGTYLRQVLDRLLIDLSWNSSRLEGNTYSKLETERLLKLGEMAEGKPVHETQMILNHKAAIEMLADQASEIGFNRYTICNLHALLSDNLMEDPSACGRLRSRAVGIGASVFYPLEGPQRIEIRFLEVLEKAESIQNPFEQAFFVMVHLPYLQAFEDVNKRVSRLAANIPLIKYNLCPLSFSDVEQSDYVSGLLGVYELNRIELLRDVFVWAYRRSCSRYSAIRETLGEPDPFRLRHRLLIGECIRDAVTQGWSQSDALERVSLWASQNIPKSDQQDFERVIHAELTGLHEGNIARYRLRPHEFKIWEQLWNTTV